MSVTQQLLRFDANRVVKEHLAEHYEEQAGQYWNKFYQSNATHFYKDRHYLSRECPHLLTPRVTVLEVGCGVGNTALPLLQENATARIYACDFSRHAIELLRRNQLYANGRISAEVVDITTPDPFGFLGPGLADICTMIFVLSAINPAKLPQVIRSVRAKLTPGSGQVYVRDYAQGDLAQQRLSSSSRAQQLAGDFYLRMDGTRAHYFTQEVLLGLFSSEGFACESMDVIERKIENRQQQVTMRRRWIQATFLLQNSSSSSSHPAREAPAVNSAAHSASGVDARPSSDRSAACSGAACDAAPSASTSMAEPLPQHARAATANSEPCQQGELELGAHAAAKREWEDDDRPGGEGCSFGLGGLFEDELAGQLEEQEVRLEGWGKGPALRVLSAPRELKHSLRHTGLLAWEGSRALAQLMLSCPAAFSGAKLLEVGCGSSPLVALAALRQCRSVTASDGSPAALQLLTRNLCINAWSVVMERMHVAALPWGATIELAAFAEHHPTGFDLIVGADVVYAQDCVQPLMHTLSTLLARSGKAKVVLAYIPRGVDEDAIIAAAGCHRLVLDSAGQLSRCWEQLALNAAPLRLLVFVRSIAI